VVTPALVLGVFLLQRLIVLTALRNGGCETILSLITINKASG